jgi:hypothetical protein
MKKNTYRSTVFQVALAAGLFATSDNVLMAQINGNTQTGLDAGKSITSGGYNTLYGHETGYTMTTATGNSMFGFRAGKLTTGLDNSFFGLEAGYDNTTGNNNSFFGLRCGRYNTTASNNSFFGFNAGFNNTTGSFNAIFGYKAGFSAIDANSNAFFGAAAGQLTTTGGFNLLAGYEAGTNNTTGSNNTMVGSSAGYSNTTGKRNVMIGNWAGANNFTGSGNVYIGYNTGNLFNNGGSNNNVLIGNYAGFDYNLKTDTAVFILNNQRKTSNPLLFGKFAGNTDQIDRNGNVTYKAQLGINTTRLENGMALTLNGRAYIGNFEADGINSGLITDSTLSNYYLWVERGVVSEDFAIASVHEWADHVFNKDYNLMPLQEVEEYIKQNNHLPNIPSAQELKKKGYTVQDMSRRFMLKIEELTLHAIEQHKQIAEQQKQISTLQEALTKYQSLEAEIKALKAAIGK